MKRETFILCSALLAAGCGTPKSNNDLKVGVIISVTGNYGAGGPSRLQGVELAFEEINKAGGVLGGRNIVPIHKDDATDADNGKAAATDLIQNEHVPVIVGASASKVTVGISDVTVPAQIPQISGSSTSPLISSIADNGYVFRTCPSDALQGKLLAEKAYAAGKRHAAGLHTGDAYSKGLCDAFKAAFEALGGTATLTQVDLNKTSYVSDLTSVYGQSPAPDTIVMPLYTFEAVQVIKDYNANFSSQNTLWLFPDSVAEQAFIDGVGGQAAFANLNHIGSGPGTPKGASADAFIAAYKAKYGAEPESTSFAINFYDAGYLVALAIEAAQKAEGPAIKDQLTAVSKGGTAYGPGDYKTAAAAAKAGDDINYEGASGNVDFDTNGDVVAPYDLWKVQNGQVSITDYAVLP